MRARVSSPAGFEVERVTAPRGSLEPRRGRPGANGAKRPGGAASAAAASPRLTGLTRAEAGQIGGMVTLQRHGIAHFRRIARSRPAPAGRGLRAYEVVVGTPRGARLAREIRNSLGGDRIRDI